MEVKSCILTVLFWSLVTAKTAIPIQDGYYWRDFSGEVPSDAMTGGLENTGKRTYIGQGLYPTKPYLVPGEIRSDKQLYYQMNGPEVLANNIKILCTKHPEKYHWVKTSMTEIRNLNREYFVIGGWEGLLLYIGRALHEEEKVVGKINLDHDDKAYTALWIAHNGREHHIHENFEVLMYNPEAKSQDDSSALKTITINIIKN